MEIIKIHDITFGTEESIVTASLSRVNELILLMSSGNVIRYYIEEQKGEYLFSVKSNFSHEDGGFDINAPSTIYTLDSIVVIVNNYKRHGFVHYPDKYKSLHLWRQDYRADISYYPLVLFKDDAGTPHMIYSEAWNHIQVMNLDTRQILTASKSLIEEGAEERHVKYHEKNNEYNKLPWPRPYDYFFGRLELSPNNKQFLSAGWAWGSCDAYNVYDLERFIKSNRISSKPIGFWEHNNRAVCWIDDNTVAIIYSPYYEGDEDSTKESPNEIHLYRVSGSESEFKRKITIKDLDIINSKMYFNKSLNSIVLFSDNLGLLILSINGEISFHDKEIKIDEYFTELNQFIKVDNKIVSIHQLKI